MSSAKPLVLDVDGTFLKTDMLFECFWAALGKDPIATIGTTVGNIAHPAVLKHKLAEIAELRTDLLPVHPEIQDLVEHSKSAGREVVLASASDISLVKHLAADHGLSDRVFASDGKINLKGRRKADALVAAFGEEGFDYAGNERTDLAIWEHAENALVVGDHASVRRALAAQKKNTTQFDGGWSARDLMRALRPHQWVKNALLLLPMLAAHDFRLSTLMLAMLGMVAFSAAASSIYI